MAGAIAPTRLIAGIEIGLVLLLAFLTVQIVWTWATPLPPVDGSIAALRPAPTANAQTTAALSGDLSFDPFHRDKVPLSDTSTAVVEEDAPETALDLKLYGVRAGSEATSGSAIIRTPDHKQAAFRPGMTVLKGVTLAGVFPDRVVISRNGVQESLYLDADRRAPSATAATAPRRASTVQTERTKPNNTAPRQLSTSTGAADLPAVFQTLGLKPQMSASGMNGLYVSASGNATVLAGLGLEDGDVVRAIDGIRLTGAQAMGRVQERLEEEDSVRLLIERDGAEQVIEVDVAGLRP